MSLRIVIDARHLKDFGVGTYIRNLTRALGERDQENEYTLVVYRDDVRALSTLPSNFKTAVYDRRDSSLRDNVAFPVFLRNIGADLIHIPHHHVPLLLPKPYVVTVHDLSSFRYREKQDWRSQFEMFRARRGMMRATMVIAVSGATRREVQSLLGVPPSRVRQIYNAPDPRFSDRKVAADARTAGPKAKRRYRESVLERYQINYPFILYVGTIRPQKNVPRLVEAFAVLKGDLNHHPVYRDLRLIIIGDEISRYPAVRLAVMKSRVDQAVRFLGFVPIDTLRVFYEAASAFAFPSLYEGFGMPPLEAMAAGTPVVASNTSSLPEVVGDAAVVVNPENVFDIARGLRDALLDEDLRVSLVARGYQQVKRFSWERTAEEVLETYADAVGQQGRSQ